MELRGSGSGGLRTRVHGVIIAPRNFVISTLLLSLRIKVLAFDLVGTEVRKADEGFNKLWEDSSPVSTDVRSVKDAITTHQWSKRG